MTRICKHDTQRKMYPGFQDNLVYIQVTPCTSRFLDRTGQDRTGQDRTGQDRTGQDRTGQDRTGQDRTGQDRTFSICGTSRLHSVHPGFLQLEGHRKVRID